MRSTENVKTSKSFVEWNKELAFPWELFSCPAYCRTVKRNSFHNFLCRWNLHCSWRKEKNRMRKLMAKRSTRILNDKITMNRLRHRLWHGNVCHHRLQTKFSLWFFLHARYHRGSYIIMNRMKTDLKFWRMQSQLSQISVAVLLAQFWNSFWNLFSCILWFLNVDREPFMFSNVNNTNTITINFRAFIWHETLNSFDCLKRTYGTEWPIQWNEA